MSDVVVRPATPADLSACAKIMNNYIDTTDWLPRQMSHREIEALFPKAFEMGRKIRVADESGTVVGYISTEPKTPSPSHVTAFYLKPESQRMGIGKQMLDVVKQTYPDGLELTVWEPNNSAKAFYEREGFVEIPELREDETEDGVPTIFMRWRHLD